MTKRKYCVKRISKPVKRLVYTKKFKQASIKFNSYRCVLCYETHVRVNRKEEKCRRCGISICNHCFCKHMLSTIDRAAQYEKDPHLKCPCCMLDPWFKPDKFFVPCSSAPVHEDYIEVYFGTKRPYYLHAIHDDEHVVGYVSLQHTADYDRTKHSFHVRDIKALEQFAYPIKTLKLGLEEAPGSVCHYYGEHEEDFFCTLEDAGVDYKRIGDHFAVECLEDAIGLPLF